MGGLCSVFCDFFKDEWKAVKDDHAKKVIYFLWMLFVISIVAYSIYAVIVTVKSYQDPEVKTTYTIVDEIMPPATMLCAVADANEWYWDCDEDMFVNTTVTVISSETQICIQFVPTQKVVVHKNDVTEVLLVCKLKNVNESKLFDCIYPAFALMLFDGEKTHYTSDNLFSGSDPITSIELPECVTNTYLTHSTTENRLNGFDGRIYPISYVTQWDYHPEPSAPSFIVVIMLESGLILHTSEEVVFDWLACLAAIGGAAGFIAAFRQKFEQGFKLLWKYWLEPCLHPAYQAVP